MELMELMELMVNVRLSLAKFFLAAIEEEKMMVENFRC